MLYSNLLNFNDDVAQNWFNLRCYNGYVQYDVHYYVHDGHHSCVRDCGHDGGHDCAHCSGHYSGHCSDRCCGHCCGHCCDHCCDYYFGDYQCCSIVDFDFCDNSLGSLDCRDSCRVVANYSE